MDMTDSWISRLKRKQVLCCFNISTVKSSACPEAGRIRAGFRFFESHFGGLKQCCSVCFPHCQKLDLPGLLVDVTKFPVISVVGSRLNLCEGSEVPWFADVRYTLKRKCNHAYPDLWSSVLHSDKVEKAINQELREGRKRIGRPSKEETEEAVSVSRIILTDRAKNYLTNMRARVSAAIVRFCGWCFFKVYKRLFKSILVSKKQLDKLQQVTKEKVPIIYLPQHRSHLDYLLITFVLWHWDIRIPHIAAGDNLNLSGFGWLLKSVGAFFIRRRLDESSNKRDYLYRALLQSYMTELLKSGEQIEIFLEGGRSRSGKPLLPKSGLLSVVIEACIEGVIEDAYLVPVSYSYERLLEGGFTNELLGGVKQKESLWMLIKNIFHAFGSSYGSVRVDFGSPVSLKDFLSVLRPKVDCFMTLPSSDNWFSVEPGFHAESSSNLQAPSPTLTDNRLLIKAVSEHLSFDANENAALNASQLLATLLLGKYRCGGSLEDISLDFVWLAKEALARKRDIIGFNPVDESYFVPDVILRAADLLGCKFVEVMELIEARHNDIGKESPSASNDRSVSLVPNSSIVGRMLLCYYKNGVLAAFAVDCIIATAVLSFGVNVAFSEEELIARCLDLCNLLKFEFLLFRPCVKPRSELKKIVLERFCDKTSVLRRFMRKQRAFTGSIMRDEEWNEGGQDFNLEQPEPSSVLLESEREWMESVADEFDAAEEMEGEETHVEQKRIKDENWDSAGSVQNFNVVPEEVMLAAVDYEQAYARDVLNFYKNLLRPILIGYFWVAAKLDVLVEKDDFGEAEFILWLQKSALEEISSRGQSSLFCGCEEGANTECFKNALKLFLERKIIRHSLGGKNRVFLDPLYSDKRKLEEVCSEIKIFL